MVDGCSRGVWWMGVVGGCGGNMVEVWTGGRLWFGCGRGVVEVWWGCGRGVVEVL